MTTIIGWQVFGRYVLGSSPSWSEQAALTIMIWFIFLAGAAGVREKFHIRIIAVERAVPAKTRKGMRVFQHLVLGLCGLAMLWWGGELVIRTWSHDIPSLGLPRGVAYLALPIAGFLIAIFSIENLIEDTPDASTEIDTSLYDEKAGLEEMR
jgi:TRAP-type C4-dicarboxylate transport system permease small subunit